ncbi:Eco57I restriction-modification methylase domain-containing protein, partial [bacterium]|nr:Eco57I restriction-modification methylase domain-containing protein [bacterium]
DGDILVNKKEYGVKNLFRYSDQFAIDEMEVLALFHSIPFLNGGLFDCLDKENDQGKVLYCDGFSRNKKKRAMVPDFLFFSPEIEYDLNERFGTKNKRYKVKGLINILSGYKFTVAENTPIEEEVALDPELLGRTFENLLASYNPETKTTARKQTGSFYTPREIVNYMVDESLKTYLKQALTEQGKIKAEDADVGLDILFSYTEREHAFSEDEAIVLIQAIDACKILDPACGSGAFPMGILHKLVHVLHKLDPRNEQWKERQIQKVRQVDDPAMRDKFILDIESAFENNELDYGRKLYLIESCIYGVDIQPIAVQIAKLRFFISLIVDQKKRIKEKNYGIRSLPNLETKFVAADTLIGLEKPELQRNLFENKEISVLVGKMEELRHRYFSARTRDDKLSCQREDKKLRQSIAKLLVKDGWAPKSANQIVQFDPYDQNASSPFFDPEWMFGLRSKHRSKTERDSGVFDVVIGNPPFVQIKQIPWEERKVYQGIYKSAVGRFNLFYFFLEISGKLTKKSGISSYIVPDRLLLNTQCHALRKWLLIDQTIIEMASFADSVFEAVVDSIIIFYRNRKCIGEDIKVKNQTSLKSINNSIFSKIPIGYFLNSPNNQFDLSYDLTRVKLIEKIKEYSIELSMISNTKDGIIQGKVADKLFITRPYDEDSKPLLFGQNISKYLIKFNNIWVNYKPTEMMQLEVERRGEGIRHGLWMRTSEIFERNKILTRQTADEIIAAYDTNEYFYSNTLHGTTLFDSSYNPYYLLALLNSKLMTWYYRCTTAESGKVFAQVKINILRQLPIRFIKNQLSFIALVKYLMISKRSLRNSECAYFERLIDAMVYELYFPDEIRSAGCEVLIHLKNLPELKDDMSDEQKLTIIEKIYKELSDPKHPVRISMFKMETVEEVRIIEGKQ